MQRVTLVRYAAKPDRADENEALSRAVFDELRANAPSHIAYAVMRDGTDFLHLFVNTRDEAAEMLVDLPSFKAYSAGIADRCVAPPDIMRMELDLIEAYGLPKA